MTYIKNLCALSLAAFMLAACSTAPKGDTVATAARPASEAIAQTQALKEELVIEAIPGSAGKVSWTEYESAMRALEADPLTAAYYLDMALVEVYTEQKADTLGSPEDSAYFAAMPRLIVSALESLYPRLASQGTDLEISTRKDFDADDFDLEAFEETPMDSVEKEMIMHFLDTLNLSRFSLPMEINERVMQELHFLTVSVRKFTDGSLSRKTLLDSMIYAKLKARNMPSDLIYLAFVESGFKTQAYSKAKAAGVWQFIPGTGKRYGLPVDFWVDMRRNPEAATDAALSYLSDLYNEFGDWHLAMAAYNCGEGRIRRLVKEFNAANPDKKATYWDLKLPRETMHYVPRILAATIIGHFPQHYSFTVEKQNRIPFDTVTVKDCVPLDKVGSALGVSVNTIRDLNPELIRWCTPPNLKSYSLRVPKGSREKFLAAYEKMDKSQFVRWQQYKVQKGDNLGYISRQFGLKVADIQAANNLKGTNLRVGQVLIIPMPGGGPAPKQKQAAEKTEARSSNGLRTYVVKSGDNLSSISRRFGVSSQNLIDWNNLEGNKINVGQSLYLQNPLKKTEKKEVPIANNSNSYVVKAGDNLWEISRAFGITVQQLLEWNPGIDKKIYPGMKIKIAP